MQFRNIRWTMSCAVENTIYLVLWDPVWCLGSFSLSRKKNIDVELLSKEMERLLTLGWRPCIGSLGVSAAAIIDVVRMPLARPKHD